MAYSTANPPSLISPAFAGGGATGNLPSTWGYVTADVYSTVAGAGYITNGGALGMKVGDIVLDTGTSGPTLYVHRVTSVSATYPGAVNLSAGTQFA